MSKFSKSNIVENVFKIQKYPDQCMTMNCENKTDVVYVTALQQATGKTVVGNYAELKAGEYSMQTGYVFKGWVTKCCWCYSSDLKRLGKEAIVCAANNRKERDRIFSVQ